MIKPTEKWFKEMYGTKSHFNKGWHDSNWCAYCWIKRYYEMYNMLEEKNGCKCDGGRCR